MANNQKRTGLKHSRVGTQSGKRRGDRNLRAMAQREKDKRVQESLAEVAEAQRRLDARIHAEQAEAHRLDRERLLHTKHEIRNASLTADQQLAVEKAQREEDLADLKAAIEKRNTWPLSEARNLIREGYTLESTIKRTGWPEEMLADVKAGVW